MKIFYPWIWLLLACVTTVFQAGSLCWKISLNGINFDGQANFRFTIYTEDGKAVWRNGEDANATIAVPVSQGRYSGFAWWTGDEFDIPGVIFTA